MPDIKPMPAAPKAIGIAQIPAHGCIQMAIRVILDAPFIVGFKKLDGTMQAVGFHAGPIEWAADPAKGWFLLFPAIRQISIADQERPVLKTVQGHQRQDTHLSPERKAFLTREPKSRYKVAMPNNGGGARNHHFVPQFYLKGFAKPRSKDGKLFVCDMKERRRFQTRPRNIAARRDFNRVEAGHLDPNIVESQLGAIEGEFDQAFRRIIDAQSITSHDDFSAVLGLLARLFIAHPKFRAQRERIMSDLTQKLMRNMVASKERWDAIEAQGEVDGAADSPISFEDANAAIEQGLIVPRINKDCSRSRYASRKSRQTESVSRGLEMFRQNPRKLWERLWDRIRPIATYRVKSMR